MNPIHISSKTGKSICVARTRDSGSFVGISAWEGQEGFGVRVIYSFFVWVLLTQMETH